MADLACADRDGADARCSFWIGPTAIEDGDPALYEPDEFYYSTSQLFSGTTEILWKDHALIFRSRPAGDPSRVRVITRRLVPNSHQWAEFWQTMDRLGLGLGMAITKDGLATFPTGDSLCSAFVTGIGHEDGRAGWRTQRVQRIDLRD